MFAFAASFLNAGTACQLEQLICIVGTDPGLCSPDGTHRDPDRGATASSWHSMMDLILSALQVRLNRLQLRVGNRWDGGAPKPSPPVSLMMPAASGYSSTATSRLQSWAGLPDFHLLQLFPCKYVTENHFAMGACCSYSC